MSATQERQAVPGTTPIREVLGFEERLTAVEAENRELRQMLDRQTSCISVLNSSLYRAQNLLRMNAVIDIAHNDRLMRLEAVGSNDRRLSEVLGGLEARLSRIEVGEGLLP